MPHYADGTPAMVGDVVKGKGYNVCDAGGQLKEFVGTVIGIVSGSQSCNVQVAHVVTKEVDNQFAAWSQAYDFFAEKGVTGCGLDGGRDNIRIMARVSLEYGQCDHFTLLHRPQSVQEEAEVKDALAQAHKETAAIRKAEMAGERS
jgi:hypothetical protein